MSSKTAFCLVIFSVCQIIDAAPQYDGSELLEILDEVRNLANEFSSKIFGFDLIPEKPSSGGFFENFYNQLLGGNYNEQTWPAQEQTQEKSVDTQGQAQENFLNTQEQAQVNSVETQGQEPVNFVNIPGPPQELSADTPDQVQVNSVDAQGQAQLNSVYTQNPAQENSVDIQLPNATPVIETPFKTPTATM